MPWNPRDTMNLRLEFVQLASQDGANRRELCRRFGISPKTGYKWLERHAQGGTTALTDHSRRPRQSPARTTPSVEQQVVQLRRAHPAWGGRKISRRLRDLGHADVPAPSTVTDILHRHGLIDPAASDAVQPGNASSMRSPTISGRWISRAGFKHVNPGAYAFHQIFGSPYSHEVSRFIFGKQRRGEIRHLLHQLRGLSNGQTTDCKPVKRECRNLSRGLNAKIFEQASLNDSKTCLMRFQRCP